MLARVPPAVLARLRLPLGGRDQGRGARRGRRGRHGRRHRAREPGRLLPRRRRARRLPLAAGRAALAPAASATRPGQELGRHAGAVAYTPGQRRGLGLAAAEPLYVLRSDAARNELVVGPRSRLASQRCAPARRRLDSRHQPRARQAARALAHGRGERRGGARRACAWCSTSPSTASPRGRPRCSTTTPARGRIGRDRQRLTLPGCGAWLGEAVPGSAGTGCSNGRDSHWRSQAPWLRSGSRHLSCRPIPLCDHPEGLEHPYPLKSVRIPTDSEGKVAEGTGDQFSPGRTRLRQTALRVLFSL